MPAIWQPGAVPARRRRQSLARPSACAGQRVDLLRQAFRILSPQGLRVAQLEEDLAGMPERTRNSERLITVVVPLLDEMESLTQLALELRQMADKNGLQIEVIFVDDGSVDGSWETIRQICQADRHNRGIRLSRNFGRAAALAAGFEAASGDVLIQMDADLQDVPEDVPLLLEKLDRGFEIVNGWKRDRHEAWHRGLIRRVFNGLTGRISGIALHDHGCGFRCFRVDVIRQLRPRGEMSRFIPVLGHARGYKITELQVRHRPRRWGRSKQGHPFWNGLSDLLIIAFPERSSRRTGDFIIQERFPG